MGKKSRRGRPPKAERQRAAEGNASNAAAGGAHGWAKNDPVENVIWLAPEDWLEKTLMPFIRNAEKAGLGVDDIFQHHHNLSHCNEEGDFFFKSHFIFRKDEPGLPLALYVSSMISCCGGLDDAQIFATTFSDPSGSKKELESFSVLKTVSVPYSVCTLLVGACLHRMEEDKRVLRTSCEKAAFRIYGLDNSKGAPVLSLPKPAPAPNVDALWSLLHREEYDNWALKATAIEVYESFDSYHSEAFTEALSQIGNVAEMNLPLLMNHMALWHTLRGETEEASWLLWEATALNNTSISDSETAAKLFENSAVVQTLLNKSFPHVLSLQAASTAPKIPDGVVFTAKVAPVSLSFPGMKMPQKKSVSTIAKAVRGLKRQAVLFVAPKHVETVRS